MISLQVGSGDVTVRCDPRVQPARDRPEPATDLETTDTGFETQALDPASGQRVQTLLEQLQTP